MKFNPIRICSCQTCRYGSQRRFYYKVANRKFRHKNKQTLKTLSDFDKFDEILIAAGYTD
jgi:hypothetical protein